MDTSLELLVLIKPYYLLLLKPWKNDINYLLVLIYVYLFSLLYITKGTTNVVQVHESYERWLSSPDVGCEVLTIDADRGLSAVTDDLHRYSYRILGGNYTNWSTIVLDPWTGLPTMITSFKGSMQKYHWQPNTSTK